MTEREAVIAYCKTKVATAKRMSIDKRREGKTEHADALDHYATAYGALAGEIEAGFHMTEEDHGKNEG